MDQKKFCEFFLEFALCGESYCVCVKYVKEVKEGIKIKRLPKLPEYVVGVTEFEGRLVPVIDLREYVGCSGKENPKAIFLEVDGHNFALLVDDALEIKKKEKSKIEEIPEEIKPMLENCLIGAVIEKEEIIPIFNPKKFLEIALMVKLRICTTPLPLLHTLAQEGSSERLMIFRGFLPF